HPTTGQPIPTKKTQKTKTSINKTNTLSSSQTTPTYGQELLRKPSSVVKPLTPEPLGSTISGEN
ncbi:MAG: hypothetical protein E6X12_09825, partial [Actinomyces sp.]|nr:hypothetical protein [Actinomycetaceae bacterium]MDU1352813.1 hypothetical protein [Actinomyces sp.]MBS6365071.1 hypothetical protein [Actinomycetaceae bacterium]MDU5006751.1 hypothetical protein [Actinomyces sp.]MDU5116037.1 hypothetical protein [Actinomyces sp.]